MSNLSLTTRFRLALLVAAVLTGVALLIVTTDDSNSPQTAAQAAAAFREAQFQFDPARPVSMKLVTIPGVTQCLVHQGFAVRALGPSELAVSRRDFGSRRLRVFPKRVPINGGRADSSWAYANNVAASGMRVRRSQESINDFASCILLTQ